MGSLDSTFFIEGGFLIVSFALFTNH